MSITGIPASIILTTGAVIVSMSTAWMATKSHFSDAISSTRASCFVADSSGSNQVTSTLNSRPQYSAASFPCAHQLTCRPMFENAARSRLREWPALAPLLRGGEEIDAAEGRDAGRRCGQLE